MREAAAKAAAAPDVSGPTAKAFERAAQTMAATAVDTCIAGSKLATDAVVTGAGADSRAGAALVSLLSSKALIVEGDFALDTTKAIAATTEQIANVITEVAPEITIDVLLDALRSPSTTLPVNSCLSASTIWLLATLKAMGHSQWEVALGETIFVPPTGKQLTRSYRSWAVCCPERHRILEKTRTV